MATVTIRVRMNRTFDVICDAMDADEAVDDIVDKCRLDDEFIQACTEEMTVVEGTYDEVEEEDEAEEEGEFNAD